MADETTQASGQPVTGTEPPATGEANDQSPTTVTPALTLEELDAQWRNRMSGKDKAHKAESDSLRSQNAALQAQLEKDRSEREAARLAGMSEAERVAAERDALKTQLEEERRARVVDTRKAKYPNIAADFDDEVIAAMDEAKLAALNERLAAAPQAGTPPSLIDPNSSARTLPAGQKPVSEKTREELIADLKEQSPSFVASLGQGR